MYTVSTLKVSQSRDRQGGLGLNPPFEFDMLQKLYYLCKGDQLFSHTFCLLICRLDANTTQ